MDDYLIGVLSNIGIVSFVALSAYLLLLTGEISFGQQAFFAIGAYAAGIATAHVGLATLSGSGLGRRDRRRARHCWSASRHCGCTAFISPSRHLLSRKWSAFCSSCSAIRSRSTASWSGPNGADGFRNIRYIFDNNIDPFQFLLLIYALLAAALARIHAA